MDGSQCSPSSGLNPLQKFRTYAVTLRPRNGIDDSQASKIVAWMKKRCTHLHVVSEKTGSARHVHAALYLKMDVTRSNFATVLVRLGAQLGFDEEEKVILRKGIRILYSDDFVQSYLDKDDDTEVLISDLPAVGTLYDWYPPKPSPVVHTAKHSKYYWDLELLWNTHKRPVEECNTQNVRNFLFDMMYNKRCIPVIRDDK